MIKDNISEIQDVVDNYFSGIFYGDTEKISKVFHSKALLFGDINGLPYFKTLPEYLEGVKNRKSPHDNGESFTMKLIYVELLNEVALLKLHCPMLGYNYYDYLSLNKINGNWLIVNKLFTNVKTQ